MRLRSTILDRRSYASLPSGELGAPAVGEAGASSDQWWSELQGGGPDVNPELTGSAKFPVYDEMALTDPTIKSLLMLWTLVARSAVWACSPRTDEPEAATIRDYVAWNVGLEGELGEMDLSWSAGIGLTMNASLKSGPSIEELVWDDVRPWYDADGDAHLVRPLGRLAPRPASSISHVRRQGGRISEIEQVIPGTRPMPIEKLSYVVLDPDETGRWEGSSMIRPAWAAWRIKKQLVISAGLGWDRFAAGVPVLYYPDTEDARVRAKRIVQQVRQHERAGVWLPSSGPSQSGNGRPDSEWYFELLNGAATMADPVPLLRFFTEQESEAGLAHFSRLGTTESGSRAVGEVQIDPFFLGVQTAASEVARSRERQVFRRIVEVNFGTEAADRWTPKLNVSKIQAHNVETVARAISYLSPAGFTFTDEGAQNDVRELLGFEKLDLAAEAMGVPRDKLLGVLQGAGLDSATLAGIVAQLPAGVGVARNVEGAGLPVAA